MGGTAAEAAPAADAHLRAREAELEALYRSHFRHLAGYFRHQGQAPAQAQDLAQETFVNAFRALPSFRGDSLMTTWLFSIGRNVLLSHVRSSKAEREAVDARPADLEEVEAPAPDPVLLADRQRLREAFAAFAREHPERAETIYLAVIEGWTREELARHLRRTPHAATEYLSQCKARLRPFLERFRPAADAPGTLDDRD